MSSTEVSTEVRTERVGSSLLITIDRPEGAQRGQRRGGRRGDRRTG